VLLQDIRCAVSRGAAAIGAELRLLSELQCAKMLSLPPPSRARTAAGIANRIIATMLIKQTLGLA